MGKKGEVLQPSDHFHSLPLDPLQHVYVFPVLRAPELDAVLQVGSHQSRVEGQNHLPRPAGHASFPAAQDTVGFLGCKRTLLAHVQLVTHQYPQVLLHRASLNPFIPQPVLIPGVALTQVQDPVVGPVEPHEVHMGPLLKLVQVPLDGILSLRHVNSSLSLVSSANVLRIHSIPLSIYQTVLVPVWTPEGHHLSLISIWTLSHCPLPSGCDHPANSSSTKQPTHQIPLPGKRSVAEGLLQGQRVGGSHRSIRKHSDCSKMVSHYRFRNGGFRAHSGLGHLELDPVLPCGKAITQAKQSQLPQPLLIRLLLQTLHQLRCPSLHTLQYLNIPLVVGGPKLNTVFEVRPHQCRVQGHDRFPSPAGHAIFDTSQDAIGFLGRLGTLLAHIQAAVNKHPQVLLCQAAFQPLFPKPVALHGVAVAQVQDLALGLVKPHTIDPSPSIQPVQVPLQSLPTLQQINTPAQLGVVCKLTESTLDPFVQIIDKDVKQNWPQHRALGNTACVNQQHEKPTCFESSSLFSQGNSIDRLADSKG
ncbi:hypothetical protein QYF61_007956, partial [Mycteria americana]